nr:PepSY domain-containing protein [Lysinibacillus timonensis]
MTNYTKWMLSLVVLMLAVSVIVIWTIQKRFNETENITIQESVNRIESLYSGKIESFEKKGDVFYMSLERNQNTYNIEVDSKTGDIINLSKKIVENGNPEAANIKSIEEIKDIINSQYKGTVHSIALQMNGPTPQYIVEITENEVLKTIIVDAETGAVDSENVREQTGTNPSVVVISSEKARDIALSRLDGIVQYVVFEQSSNGGYYLVEITTPEQRAIFEIHAISGKVLSVTRHQTHYSESDDDDNDDDDKNDSEIDDNDEDEDDADDEVEEDD